MRSMKMAAVLAAVTLSIGSMANAQAPTEGGATATPAPPATARASEDPDDRIRCRRVAVTGSLVRVVRVCKTVGEWRAIAGRGEHEARDYVDFNRGRPSGGN